MVALRGLAPELCDRIDGRVDRSTESPFRLQQSLRDIGYLQVADDHHVHVAPRRVGAARNRAVDEGNPDPVAERLEHLAQRVANAERLRGDALQLLEDRTAGIRPVVDLPTFLGPLENPRGGERREVALHQARGGAGRARDLTDIEALVRMREKLGEDGALPPPEEGGGQTIHP